MNDTKLEVTGWITQEKKAMNLFEDLAVAVREINTVTGPADYMLFIDAKTCCISRPSVKVLHMHVWRYAENKLRYY